MKGLKETLTFFTTAKGIIVAAATIIISGSNLFAFFHTRALKHDNNVIKTYIENASKANQDLRIDNWIRTDSIQHLTVISELAGIKDSVKITNKGMRKSANVLNNLQKYMIDKVATKEGVLEIQNVFNVEKRGIHIEPIEK